MPVAAAPSGSSSATDRERCSPISAFAPHDQPPWDIAPRRLSCGRGSSALGRGRRPRLDQRVVVDRLTLGLLVRELALRRDGAVLLDLGEPVVGGLLGVELRPAVALDARLLD